jgi:hypothetical protein
LGVDRDCRHVVKAANGFSHGVHLACTTLADVRGFLLSLFDEGQQIGVDLVKSVSENALMQKYDPGKPAIMASNPSLEFCGFRP